MDLINFEIITPERVVLKEKIRQITVPTKQGEITVLPHHIPLIATLQAGVIEIINDKGERDVMSVAGGFIEVLKDKVVILADKAERAAELDLKRAEEAYQRAEAAMKGEQRFDRETFATISGEMAKELARTKAAKKWKRLKNIN